MDEFEIPEAIRANTETSELPKSRSTFIFLAIGAVLLGIIGLLLAAFWFFNQSDSQVEESAPIESTSQSDRTNPSTSSESTAAQTTPPAVTPQNQQNQQKKGLLGHLPYDVAPESQLLPLSTDGSIKMRPAAAQKFEQMQAAARAEGIILVALSGHRDLQSQERLFFGVKEQRSQNTAKRAEVSAPPGYSEHHTGYAIDIGDGNAPVTNVEPEFVNTPAYRWLQQNAAKYSFELSFPPNNKQGVSFEPWHWRYVGDRDSLETFYSGKKLNERSVK